MAHEIENMMYVGEKPWHSIGVELDHPPTAEEAIIAAGLDWEVGLTYLQAGEDMLEVPGHQAVIRSSDQKVLGIVGDRYTPLQNRDAFRWFDPIIAGGRATYHTAGSLRGGAIVWVLAKLGDMVISGEDVVEKYICLTTGHDGYRCVSALPTSVRVVCNNTLTAALKDGQGDTIKVRHTASMERSLVEAQRILGVVNEQYEKLGEAFRLMATKVVTRQIVDEYLEEVFPIDEDAKISTRTKNIRENVIQLFETGPGANLPAARGTMWGLYNAANFQIHTGGHSKDLEKRLESSWMGVKAARDADALQIAVRMAA